MWETLGAWASANAATAVVGTILLFMYRDLHTHMATERAWREKIDTWVIDHVTGHS